MTVSWLRFRSGRAPTPGERDGIAKLARLNENGLDVEFFHIFTFT
jgi:hypothetical protein